VEPELWEPDFLAALALRLAPGGLLSTYSAATRVRVGLRAAGLVVGAGGRFGDKAEGTLASPDQELPPLAPQVARRIERRARELREGQEP
jgi:tRNA U34 5-methylaminomethyl-2-thiouridine-forming methyltransferase MnmC